ncbi:MAG: diacylglycerol kinase family protein [Coprobacillus sp.]
MKHIFMMNDTKKHHDFEKEIHDVMKEYHYEIIYTTSMQDTIQYILDYPTTARFYSVGGDGTLSGIIQAMVHKDHELVVIPLGTGNDFCRTVTSERNPKSVLIQSLSKQSQKIDSVLINDRYYINSACFGVDSVIANHVHDTPNIPLVPNSKSYIVSIMQHVFSYQFDMVKIISEDKCLYEGKVTLCTFNNGQYYGGGFHIIPHANIQDGYIDVCVVDKVKKSKIPYMLGLLLAHKLQNRKDVHYFKVKEATIYTQQISNIDGEEYISDTYHLKIVPASLNLVID